MAEQQMVQIVSANGAFLHYIEQGRGDPVIFVHGSLGDYRTWQPQVEAFSSQHRAFSYSRRYHYPNEWSGDGSDYSASLHADDLIALIESLNLAPACVVGNSYGAYTTLVAATRRPDLLRKIVIGEPPILPWLKEIPGGQPYFDDFMRSAWLPATKAFKNGDLEQGVRLFIDGVSGGPGAFDHIPAPARQRMLENARELQAETISPGYFTPITPEQVAKIRVPILLLKGENSPRMFHLVVDRLAQALPTARKATIPKASHSMSSGNPQAYNQAVMDFLFE